jgi:nicotinate-nucleotide pyrophosphorylase (carboxylating)
MSGIATQTKKYVEKINELKLENPPFIAATRKTPWMHVDKKAVAVGGGITHRLNLKDGILLKDNHLELIEQESSLRGETEAISYAISNAKINDPNIAVEVETKTEEAAFAAVTVWQKRNLKNPFIILLDNFIPQRAKIVIEKIKKENKNIFLEASGRISLDNVAEFAKSGVDVISIGALTHSPQAIDLSLDIS